MPIPLESPLHDLAEFCREVIVVEEVVYAKAGARCLGGVGGADAFFGRSDAAA